MASDGKSVDNTQLGAVNRSGYPLQIAIQRLVERKLSPLWRVRYTEHAWRNTTDDREGFIDLVLESPESETVLLVECKRFQNKEWIFIPADGDSTPKSAARALVVCKPPDGKKRGPLWTTYLPDPRTPVAMFCVMRGDAREPSVEKLGAELVSATEALLTEETQRNFHDIDHAWLQVYIPVIVTTVPLTVCSFDPDSISLTGGEIPPGAQFESVDAVRLTKPLSTNPASIELGIASRFTDESSFRSDVLADAKQRTVFIVQAEKLESFLTSFYVPDRASTLLHG